MDVGEIKCDLSELACHWIRSLDVDFVRKYANEWWLVLLQHNINNLLTRL